ncbi:MAG TPA: TonB-dependent receptor [Gemmatimonadales bacterium]|nr:TonB-dependent receptor [Gemmatimonadales bacterium]
MKRLVWFVCVLAAAALVVPARAAAAQGVTSAAVAGRITDDAGAPVSAATVALTNGSTGQRYSARSADDGRYVFENVQVGGPYSMEVRALGFESARVTGLTLTLGQRFAQNFTLKRAALEVAGVTVTAESDPLRSTARTGAATFISDSALRHLPTTSRNFTDFIQTVPQVNAPGGEPSIDGQNNRFNNIQIDGGVNNDLFGLSGSGTPGGQANAHPLSIEAVKEYQVLIAPFDVRQGNFTGGLVNAVTKSGTNEFHGSAFGYVQSQTFVGNGPSQTPISDFRQDQYGLTLGGPIARDRVHFFVATDLQSRAAPFGGLSIGPNPTGGLDSVGIGIRQVTADSVQNFIKRTFGFDPGTWSAPTQNNPDHNVFGKITAQLATNSTLEVSQNFVSASSDNLIHNPTQAQFAGNYRDGYQLSNSGYLFSSKTYTTRAKWTARLGGQYANELLLGAQFIRDHRNLPNPVPLFLIGGDRPGTWISAGSDKFSQANLLDQNIFEVTDNVTVQRGSHLITIGTHNEFFHFHNVFFPGSLGIWAFTNLDSLVAQHPFYFERALPGPLRPDGPVANFDVRQGGGYVEDRWSPDPRLAITVGLRVDLPLLDAPVRNATLDSIMGINTANFPKANPLWSPRLGFNFDPYGDQSTIVRGGVGLFAGRPPYVWISNAFSNTGLEQATLVCQGAALPAFTPNPSSQPTACAGGVGATPPIPTVNYFDSNFKFPEDFKVAIGVDHQLPWHVLGTLDFIYTRAVNQFYITDRNLKGVVGVETGEGGRPMYGTVNPVTGRLTPATVTASFRNVLEHSNRSSDRSFSITAQLQKRFGNNVEFNAGYSYSHTQDLISLTSSIAFSNYRFGALDGTLENRTLRTSVFDIPHKVAISGTVGLPYNTKLSLIYNGFSGSPYSYVVSGDINGDGVSGNDMVYVPRSQGDITLANPADWATLDAYINGEDCLRQNRGHLLPRNSCRNSWEGFLNTRVLVPLRTFPGQNVELAWDVINLPNLLNRNWGVPRQTSSFEEQNLLRLTGFDATNNRGIYALSLPTRDVIIDPLARWRMQLGLRYAF